MLFAVGGTGQHVALAAARLVRLRALPPIECTVIDNDDKGALSDALRHFGGTLSTGAEEPMPHPLPGGAKFIPTYDRTAAPHATLESLLVDPRSPEEERWLFELFFDETEGRTQVSEGMFARPNVGSTVIAVSQIDSLGLVLDHARSFDRIFFTGSLVGGTGAGLVHQLVRQLRVRVGPDKPIFGSFLLRWFSAGSGSGAYITDPGMDQNARHGVEYLFSDTRRDLSGAMLLGVPGQPFKRVGMLTTQTGAVHERPSFLHLVAARGLLLLPDAQKTEGNGHVYAFGHDDAQEDELLSATWHGGKTLTERVRSAVVAASLLEFAAEKADDIADGFGLLGRKYVDGLHQTIRDHAKAADVKPQTFTKRLAACFRAEERQLRFALAWVEDLLGKQALPERLAVATKGDADRKAVLEQAWKAPIPPPRGSEKPHVAKVALELEERLFTWATA